MDTFNSRRMEKLSCSIEIRKIEITNVFISIDYNISMTSSEDFIIEQLNDDSIDEVVLYDDVSLIVYCKSQDNYMLRNDDNEVILRNKYVTIQQCEIKFICTNGQSIDIHFGNHKYGYMAILLLFLHKHKWRHPIIEQWKSYLVLLK